jgi:hypothetical protein
VIYRNKRLLELLREAPCQLRDGKGRSIKAHDFRIAAMCYRCHTRCDQGADLSKTERVEMWEDAHRKTVGWLFLNDHVHIS